MDTRMDALHSYLKTQNALYRQQAKTLLADDRGDESHFETIRANIFEIFDTVLSAGEKACAGDPDKIWRFFSQKLEQIPASWSASYEHARQHGDTETMQIERIKLEAARAITKAADQIWREAV
ncbi:hypothetical protein B5E65_02825 [Gemmiger sp. An120]|uniref:hypothetical protein n=1 Tax=Gemmiger sp. An120 TaxID=1965549 RepID=UPI000B3AD42A|nr:hypothetical protein [Gemmiger sp. An120]OUQ43927.1 hypothetical protein B5E65_02825 [Gemmiger sp. An120]